MSHRLTNLVGFGGAAVPPLVCEYLDAGENATGDTVTGLDFGVAAADRYIVAVITVKQTAESAVSAVTIGGVSANIVVQDGQDSGSSQTACIAIALVPTGTSGTVAMTVSNDQAVTVALYRMTGLQSATPHDTDTGANTGASSLSLGINVPAGGATIAGACNSGNDTISWSGLSEDQETGNVENGHHSGVASSSDMSAETNRSISITFSDSARVTGVSASFR